ncbi:MAG: hypothetical protein NUW24_12425 [Anaerolineae bacterium]|jgi:hypothetical protein|nr:hypothetical protein [Anaerolineae bacterium]MDH7474551.1 hypothetical protein [Anaerolineae bacterium]
MNKRRPVAEIILIVIGAVLSCCWLPRGIMGLLNLMSAVGARVHVSSRLIQFLQSLSNPLTWYNQQIMRGFFMRGGNVRIGQVLNAIPLCLCPLVAIAILVVGIVLYARAGRTAKE